MDAKQRWIAVAVLGHGSMPYQKLWSSAETERLRGLVRGDDTTAATLALWLLATTGGASEASWLREETQHLIPRFRPTAAFIGRLDTDVAIRRLPTLGLFALIGGRVPLSVLDPVSGDGMGTDMDGQAGWWSLALHAEGGGRKGLSQAKQQWTDDVLIKMLQRMTYGRALSGKSSFEGDGEPPPHVAEQYGLSLVTDVRILADYPLWSKGPSVVEATMKGSDTASRNALIQVFIRLGKEATRFKNVPGIQEWTAHLPTNISAARKNKLLYALGMNTDAAIEGLVAEVAMCGDEQLWNEAVSQLCTINPTHPALDKLAERLAANIDQSAHFVSWLLRLCRGQQLAMPQDSFPMDLLAHRDADSLLATISEVIGAQGGQSSPWRNPCLLGDPTRSEFRRRLALFLGILDRLDKVAE